MFDDTILRARRALRATLALCGLCGLLLAPAGAGAQSATPNLRLIGASVLEGNTGTRTLVFRAALDAPLGGSVNGRFHTRPSFTSGSAKGGTACTGDVDYIEVDQPIVIPAGQVGLDIPVTVCSDAREEPAFEYVYVSLYDVRGATCPTVGCLTRGNIEEDDIPAMITVDAASSGRWTFGETLFKIPVQMNYPSGVPVTVNYRTREASANGSGTCALFGTDYESRSGTLTFAPGDKVAYIPVRVCKSQNQTEQTFWVDLSNATGGGAFIFRATAEMTLLPARRLGVFGLRAGDTQLASEEPRQLAASWQGPAGQPVRDLALRVRSGPLSVLWVQWSSADGLLRLCQRSAVRLGAYELHGPGSERLAAEGETEGTTLAVACSAGAAPGARQVLETPLARLHLAGSRVQLSSDDGTGEQVALTLAVSFKAGLQGVQAVELAATDASGRSAGFQRAGRLLLVPAGDAGR